MTRLDDIDRKIIARLQIDGRATVTTLAGVLEKLLLQKEIQKYWKQ
jgi:DNA-binding Lrp family transcriptional regulator